MLMTQMVKNMPAMQEARVQPSIRKIPWRRKWQSTPVFLPGISYGQRSLVGYSPWGCKELDITVWLTLYTYIYLCVLLLLFSYPVVQRTRWLDGTGWDGWMDEMVGWHKFDQTPGYSEEQGSLECYTSWGRKELDMTCDWTAFFPLNIVMWLNSGPQRETGNDGCHFHSW